MPERVVIAIGGNSLIKDDRHVEVDDQLHSVQETAAFIAEDLEALTDLPVEQRAAAEATV